MADTVSEVLPCPLCGSLCKISSTDTSTTIRCLDGNCQLSLTRFRFNDSHLKAATLAWNRRSSPSEAETHEAALSDERLREIAPCPFCGAKGIPTASADGSIYLVECDKCPVEVFAETREEAISAWNRRTQPSAGEVVPDLKLVPVERLTKEMRAAAETAARKINPGRHEDHIKSVALDGLSIYRAMVAAAPLYATPPDQSKRVERLEAEARAKAIEDCAKHFDERAKKLRDDIFATTTTRSQICRTVASELRDFARQALGDRS